jgi:hypothetical protein
MRIDKNKPALLIPKSRAGFGNRMLNLIDALTQVNKLETEIIIRDKELIRFYLQPNTRPTGVFRQPLLLSEALYRPSCINPKKFFFHAPDPEIIHDVVSFHFRGRDFSAWKPHSILKPKFFIDALKHYEKDRQFWMFTDDREHETVRKVEEFAEKNSTDLRIFEGSAYSDFSLLARSGKIVASPSTFSLCAALLGAGKIVFSRDYAKAEAEGGSEFWARLMASEQPAHVMIDLK